MEYGVEIERTLPVGACLKDNTSVNQPVQAQRRRLQRPLHGAHYNSYIFRFQVSKALKQRFVKGFALFLAEGRQLGVLQRVVL